MMVAFAHPLYASFLSPTDYQLFKCLNFLHTKHFYSQQEGENAFEEFFESQSMFCFFLFATGINLFLIGKNVLIVMVTILINKYVLESSYSH